MQANLGQMDKRRDQVTILYSNLALIQAQAIIVSLVAAVIAILSQFANEFEVIITYSFY